MSFRSFARGIRNLTGVIAVVFVLGVLLIAPVVPFVYATADTVDSTQEQLIDRPPLPDELPVAAEISTVHEVSGEPIAELSGVERREPVTLDEVPDMLVDAVLAIEDDAFYEHHGVNHQSMLRAAAHNIAARGIEQGASTITQQYVKMTLLSPEQTFDRKLHEMVWAVELERRLDKHEILERYLNAVYLGDGVYGVGTAAEHYFNKTVDELTLAEAATLAGVIQTPSAVNPVANPEATTARRNVVLRQMRAQGRIDAEAAEAAMDEPLVVDVQEDEVAEPFWVDYVKRLIYDETITMQPGLQDAIGETRQERVDALFEGGLRIHTTLNPDVHRRANETLASYLDDPENDPLGSLITVEHSTGALRALAVGPRQFGPCPEDADEDEPCLTTQVNPAMPGAGGSGRQAGSAFKPFVAAAALTDGFETDQQYATTSGRTIEGCGVPGDPYQPSNFDGASPGNLDMVRAIRMSNNVYFVTLARDVGVERVAEVSGQHGLVHANLANFGPRDCSIALGSADIFPLEMAVGYGVWANGGIYCAPYLIERVENRFGEVLYQHEPQCEQVVDPEVAEVMRELLLQPVGTGGTAPIVGASVEGAHGKTGTTQNHVDAWFVGFAGSYSTAAWIGYEQPAPLENVTVGGTWYARVTGGAVPAPMWADYMASLQE